MDANFYYSIHDKFIQRQTCSCVHLLTFSLKKKKTSPQKLLTGLLPNFIVVFLRLWLKSSLHRYRKIGLWSDTGAQAPLAGNRYNMI